MMASGGASVARPNAAAPFARVAVCAAWGRGGMAKSACRPLSCTCRMASPATPSSVCASSTCPSSAPARRAAWAAVCRGLIRRPGLGPIGVVREQVVAHDVAAPVRVTARHHVEQFDEGQTIVALRHEAEDLAAPNVQRTRERPCAVPLVLEFPAHRRSRCHRDIRTQALQDLHPRHLVHADDVLVLGSIIVQVQNVIALAPPASVPRQRTEAERSARASGSRLRQATGNAPCSERPGSKMKSSSACLDAECFSPMAAGESWTGSSGAIRCQPASARRLPTSGTRAAAAAPFP